MKNDIEGKLNTSQNKMENSMSAVETKISTDISAIVSSHTEFQEKIMDELDRWLEGVATVIEQQTQKLRWVSTTFYKRCDETSHWHDRISKLHTKTLLWL